MTVPTEEENLIACYPERAISGFSRTDSTVLFYTYINSLVSGSSVVLDLGAGRGALGLTNRSSFKRSLVNFKGRVAKVVGVDIDEAVRDNPFLDEAFVTHSRDLPFPDNTFDVIYSDWVLEHVDDPSSFVSEIERVLKPGGWFCARTPNRFGMIAVGASLIPNRLHTRILRFLQPDRDEIDVFPTRYKLNTMRDLGTHLPAERWDNHSFCFSTEIMYFARSRFLLRLSALFNNLAPSALKPVLLVFMQKRIRS